MKSKLRKLSKKDHYNCLIVAILTHGGKHDALKGTDGEKVSLAEITEYFNGSKGPALVGKPKVTK